MIGYPKKSRVPFKALIDLRATLSAVLNADTARAAGLHPVKSVPIGAGRSLPKADRLSNTLDNRPPMSRMTSNKSPLTFEATLRRCCPTCLFANSCSY